MARRDVSEELGAAIAPVARETLNDKVYLELKNSIMTGAFTPGAELTLRAVADALGTSLMPVRDAMRRLVSEHALEMRPSRKIAIPQLTEEKFLELRRIRALLEGEAAALAAERISKKELRAIQAVLKKLEALDTSLQSEFWTLNMKLHFSVYEAADSALLLSIIESLWLQIGPLLTRIPLARAVKDAADPHHLLVRALEAGDAEAARAAIVKDLNESTERVMAEFRRWKTTA